MRTYVSKMVCCKFVESDENVRVGVDQMVLGLGLGLILRTQLENSGAQFTVTG